MSPVRSLYQPGKVLTVGQRTPESDSDVRSPPLVSAGYISSFQLTPPTSPDQTTDDITHVILNEDMDGFTVEFVESLAGLIRGYRLSLRVGIKVKRPLAKRRI